jgi:hypothetical protein
MNGSTKIQQMWMRIVTLLALFSLVPMHLSAQQGNLMYLQHDVPQAVLLNPALTIRCKTVIGVPGIASLHTGYGNSFTTYNDLDQAGSLNLDGIYGQLKRNNLMKGVASYAPVFAGYRKGDRYVHVAMTERAAVYASFPRTLAGLALYGNSQFIGKTARIRNLRLNAMYFREYAAGYSYEYDQYTRFGIRAKLLFGKAGLQTARSRLSLSTEEDAFLLEAQADARLNASFPLTINQNAAGTVTGAEIDDIEWIPFILNRKNPGVGIDLGMVHEYSDQLTLSASLLDLGLIRWGTDLNNLSGALSFRFDGIAPDAAIVSGTDLSGILDSLVNTVAIERMSEPYVQLLPLSLMVGAEYRWKENLSFGAVSRSTLVNGFLDPTFSIVAKATPHEHVHASVAWSYMNHSLKNIGLSLAYTGKEVQLYLLSENVLGFLQPFDTRTLHLQFGMSLMFGCPRNRWLIHREEVPKMPEGRCGWAAGKKKKMPKRW